MRIIVQPHQKVLGLDISKQIVLIVQLFEPIDLHYGYSYDLHANH